MRLGGAKTAIGPSMRMRPRSGECTAVEARKTKARAAVKAVLGDMLRMAATRTKVAMVEVERMGRVPTRTGPRCAPSACHPC